MTQTDTQHNGCTDEKRNAKLTNKQNRKRNENARANTQTTPHKHTNKTSYQPNVRSPGLRTHWTENWEFRKTVGQNIADWGALEGAPIRMCIRALAREWDYIKNCEYDFYRKITHIFLLYLKTQCDPRWMFWFQYVLIDLMNFHIV